MKKADLSTSAAEGPWALGRHLLQTALDNDFEPALSHRLKLDHGTCIPLGASA